MSFLINMILKTLLGDATALASSDRVKTMLVSLLSAALTSIGLPAVILKVNAFCGSCVPSDFIAHITTVMVAGILTHGAVLIHSIGQRDTLTPQEAYQQAIKSMTPEQIIAATLKGSLPPAPQPLVSQVPMAAAPAPQPKV